MYRRIERVTTDDLAPSDQYSTQAKEEKVVARAVPAYIIICKLEEVEKVPNEQNIPDSNQARSYKIVKGINASVYWKLEPRKAKGYHHWN
jgi:hypothetical protein